MQEVVRAEMIQRRTYRINRKSMRCQNQSGQSTSFRLTILFLSLLTALSMAHARHQQGLPPPSEQNPLLEVVATDYQIFSSVKYVYLRIREDGTVEYHDPLHIDLFHPTLIRRTLPAAELNQLKSGLSAPNAANLTGEYHGGLGVDTSLRWDVSFRTGSETHRLTLWNFTYGLDRPPYKRPIPEPARELGCLFEEIRNKLDGSDRRSERCNSLAETTKFPGAHDPILHVGYLIFDRFPQFFRMPPLPQTLSLGQLVPHCVK